LVLVVVGVAAAGLSFIDAHWPYRYRNVEPLLESVFASQIKIDRYHRTYFPHPGFVASGLTLRRNSAPNLPPVGTAGALIVQGTWHDLLLLRERVRLVDVKGLHIVIPPVGSQANHEDFPVGSSADFAGPTTAIEQLLLHDATLEILRTNGGRYTFPIKRLSIRNLQRGKTITYSVDMQNARPTGHILSAGSFGPLTPKNLGATPLSGDFNFSPVNLKDIGGIRGALSSKGHFRGNLASIAADATSDTPDFAVGSGRASDLAGTVNCTINGLDGDVVLNRVELKIGATAIEAQGRIAGSPKVTDVDATVTRGRVEDLLRPFLHEPVPVAGVVWLHSHAHLEAARKGRKFLQRLQMDAALDVPAERLTNRAKEQELSAFSKRAQGLKSPKPNSGSAEQEAVSSADVLSSLNGRVTIRDGVLSTQRMTVQMPGAAVNLNGTYSLNEKTVHMVGEVRMDSDISHVTTGFKSFLLKPLAPFFKKGKAGAVIPIAITGGPKQYKITQNVVPLK
jgi:hypothetical protein